jgi:hypothetical protein
MVVWENVWSFTELANASWLRKVSSLATELVGRTGFEVGEDDALEKIWRWRVWLDSMAGKKDESA